MLNSSEEPYEADLCTTAFSSFAETVILYHGVNFLELLHPLLSIL